jgi:ribokinase
LREEGVDVRHVVKDRGAATGVALISVDAHGEKQIIVAPGANDRLNSADVQRVASVLRRADVLVMQFEVPMKANLAAARIAHRAGVSIVLDPAPAVAQLPPDLLRYIAVVRANEFEANALSGVKVTNRASAKTAALRLLELGPRAAIISVARGNLVVWREASSGGENEAKGISQGKVGELWLPRLKINAVDATGAGDAFAAALGVALAEGQTVPDAASFANAAAALATTKLGAQEALPRRAAILALLRRKAS